MPIGHLASKIEQKVRGTFWQNQLVRKKDARVNRRRLII